MKFIITYSRRKDQLTEKTNYAMKIESMIKLQLNENKIHEKNAKKITSVSKRLNSKHI